MASVGSGYVRLVLICNFGLLAEGSLHKFMVGVLGVIWRYWGVCSPMGPTLLWSMGEIQCLLQGGSVEMLINIMP